MRRALPRIQLLLGFVGIGLAITAIVLLVIAAGTSGADCTFDNFACRRNQVLTEALRCVMGALVAGIAWAALRAARKRRHVDDQLPDA